jgi:uncharacterized protein (TIGR02588 family)
MTMADPQQAATPAAATGEAPPFWEWVAAAIGLLLVLACMGYLGLQALRGDAGTPDPVVELVEVREQGGQFLARVRVSNRSRGTAEALVIAGELRQDGQVLERSEMEFEFLPGVSAREGGLFFRHDPRRGELRLAPVSYRAP